MGRKSPLYTMVSSSTVVDLVLAGATIGAGRLASRHYRALPEAPLSGNDNLGHVSIIVPARDEAPVLGRLLHSLRMLTYNDLDILVVDDESTDGTGDLARRLGVPVLPVKLAAGWSGKANACWVGAQHTAGEWLLFCDADTEHAPESLSCALALAERERAGMVSLLAHQTCGTVWERLLLPYAYFLYFVGARGINRRTDRSTANGQYILCRRESYQRFGGHAAVYDSLVEDVALARRAAAGGERVVLARGERIVSVRMYDSLEAIWQGFAKNSFRFVRLSPADGLLTAGASVLFASLFFRTLRARRWSSRLGLGMAPIIALLPWYRDFGVQGRYVAGFPLAAIVFQLIALDSLRSTVVPGATHWKGREY